MADPFSLATGVISLVVVTLQAIAGVSRMLDRTIAAHRAAEEELERLRCDLEILQGRMESNHGKLEAFASDTKDRGFKKVLQSYAAVVRLCQALKETDCTLKRLTDQTESEEATLRTNTLPSKKRSLAFVRAVLKYNVSPQTIDEMISNLREMQKEIQDCLRNLETSFSNVDDLYDLFRRQLARVSTYSRLSTSTTLTARVQLVGWLENFGGRRGFSERSRNESRALHTFLQADQDEDEPHTASLPQDATSTEVKRRLDAEISPAPPPLPSRPVRITVPLKLNRVNPPALVQSAKRWIPQQDTNRNTGTGGSNVGHYVVPPKAPQTGSATRIQSTSSHRRSPRSPIPTCPPSTTAPPPVSSRPVLPTMPLNRVNPLARVEATQRWIPPQDTNPDTAGGGNVGHHIIPPKGPQTGSDTRKPSTSSHGESPVPTCPPPTATQSDWAKHQQLFTVKLREWQTQVTAADEELNRDLECAKNNEEIEKVMEKFHNRMRGLLRDRGGELDELEQSSNGSASSAYSEDSEEEPESDEVAEVDEPEELWAASGLDHVELVMNGQGSPDPGLEIPGSENSSDAPPPTENDEDHRAAQRRIIVQRSRSEKTLSHTPARLAKLTPTTGTATPTRSRSPNIDQSPTNSKVSNFPSPSESAIPTRTASAINSSMPLPTLAAPLPKRNPYLSQAQSPHGRSGTLIPDRPMYDDLNWRQSYDESFRRAAQQEEYRRRHLLIQRERQENSAREIEMKRARSDPQVLDRPVSKPAQSDWAKHQQLFTVKLREWQTQVTAADEELNRDLECAKNNEEIVKVMEKFHNRMRDLLRDRGSELDELERSDGGGGGDDDDDKMRPANLDWRQSYDKSLRKAAQQGEGRRRHMLIQRELQDNIAREIEVKRARSDPQVLDRPVSKPAQSDWAKHQQLFTVKLREWQTQVTAADEELNRDLECAKNNEEIEKVMEKFHNRMRGLLRDRGGELDELEQSSNGSASSAHSEDSEEEPESDEIAEVDEPEELWAASGLDHIELAVDGQESPDPEVEIPGSKNSSDAPPPTENDEDHHAAQRRIEVQRLRSEKTLSHTPARLAKLTPTTGTATPTRSRSPNIDQSPTNSKVSNFPSPSESATPTQTASAINSSMPLPTLAAPLPKRNPYLSQAKSPHGRSGTLIPDRPMYDDLNWRQSYDESLRRAAQQEEYRRRHMLIQRGRQENISREIEMKRARSDPQALDRPVSKPAQSDWAKHQQLFTVKLREWQTQVAAAEEELNRDLECAKNNEEIEKVMEKFYNRMRDLLRDRGGELDELEQSDGGDGSDGGDDKDKMRPANLDWRQSYDKSLRKASQQGEGRRRHIKIQRELQEKMLGQSTTPLIGIHPGPRIGGFI